MCCYVVVTLKPQGLHTRHARWFLCPCDPQTIMLDKCANATRSLPSASSCRARPPNTCVRAAALHHEQGPHGTALRHMLFRVLCCASSVRGVDLGRFKGSPPCPVVDDARRVVRHPARRLRQSVVRINETSRQRSEIKLWQKISCSRRGISPEGVSHRVRYV